MKRRQPNSCTNAALLRFDSWKGQLSRKLSRSVCWLLFLGAVAAAMSGAPCFGAPPANDNFANRLQLSGSDPTAIGTTTDATIEPGEYTPRHSFGGAMTNSAWWKWTAPFDGEVTLDLSDVAVGGTTSLSVYLGDAISNLKQIATNIIPIAGYIGGPAHFRAVAGTEYQIAVTTYFDYPQFSLRLRLRQAVPPALLESIPLLLKEGQIEQILVQPDGKIIVRGAFEYVNGSRRYGLARIDFNGSLDTTWIPKLDGPVRDMALSDSALFIVGSFANVGDQTGFSIAKIPLSGDGSPDPIWRGDNQFSDDFGSKAPGVIIAVRGSTVYTAGGHFFVRVFNEGGSGATLGEVLVNYTDWRSLRASTSRVICCGTHYAGEYTLSRVFGGGGFAASVFNNTFDQQGVLLVEFAATDDELIVTGNFISPLLHELAKMDISGMGTLDENWHPEPDGKVKSMSVLRGVPETHVFVTGDFSQVGGRALRGMAKLNVSGDGSADARFTADVIAPGAVKAVEEGVYVAGAFLGPQDTAIHGLVRLDLVTGKRDETFNVHVQVSGSAMAIARQPDGKVIVGGDFEFAGDLPRKNLARFDEDGQLDKTWSPNVDGPVKVLACASQAVYVAGDFSHIGNIELNGLGKVAIIGSAKADSTWAPLGQDSGTVNAIAVRDKSIFFGGSFNKMGGLVRSNLAKVAADTGEADPDWAPDPSGPVKELALNGSSLFAAGGFTSIAGLPRAGLAKISTEEDGVLNPWDPNPNGAVSGLAVRGGFVYAAGAFTSIGGQARSHLARLATNGLGVADAGWNPIGPSDALDVDSKVAVTESGKTVFVTALSKGGGKTWGGLARVSGATAGSIDLQWDPNPTPAGNLAMAVKSEGLYVAGGFKRIGGSDVSAVAFLSGLSAPRVVRQDDRVVIVPGDTDGVEIRYFRITEISGGGTLSIPGGPPLQAGDFITADQGRMGLSFTGLPQVSVVAASESTDAATGIATIPFIVPATKPSVFQFGSRSYSVIRGLPGSAILPLNILVKRTFGTVGGNVTYSIIAGTATPRVGATGDYLDSGGGILSFPAGSATEQSIGLSVSNSQSYKGDRFFYVQLNSVPAGSVIGALNRARVEIVDLQNFGGLQETKPVALPSPAPATISFTLDPEYARGRQWRLQGSLRWLESGETLGGLLPEGEYHAEFRPIHGYEQPNQFTIIANAAGATERFQYQPTFALGKGALRVHLLPETVATTSNPALRGEWRFEGESRWRDGGPTAGEIVGLEAGTYRIEFKEVSTRLTPPLSILTIVANQTSDLNFVYGEQQELTGAAPKVVPFATASTQAPYIYNGQLSTSLGYGSGCVVAERTVLTAAHVVFNDLALDWIPDAEIKWAFQRYHGSFEPVPLTPRGSRIFTSYQCQRKADDSPGISSQKSQGMDVAAVYFPKAVGRGGYGGYLLTDELNDWLTKPELSKMLTGYPLPPGREADWEKLWATDSVQLTFKKRYLTSFDSDQYVYVTNDIHSFPGNSGGPLYVQVEGTYYPAGIILGGSAQTLVRAIDRQVVALIQNAEDAAGVGDNITGGGLTYVSANITGTQRSKGYLKVTLHNADAQWKLSTENGFHVAGDLVLLEATSYYVDFSPLSGFNQPQRRKIEIIANQMAVLDVDYAPLASALPAWRATYLLPSPQAGDLDRDTDGDGLSDLMEFAVGGNPTGGWDKCTLPIASTYKNSVDPDDPNAEIFPTITFRKRRKPNAGITYTVVESDRPEGPWTVVLANPNAQDPYVVKQSIDSDEFEILTVRGTQSLNGEGAPPSWFLKVLVKEK